MRIQNYFTELIGNTPLLELVNTKFAHQPSSRLVTKLEDSNPAGNVKERIAKAMIEDADKTIVVILPDIGERHLSTPMFAENQLAK